MSKYLRKAKRKWTMERYQKTSFHSWDFVAKKVQARAMNLNFFLRKILKASFLTGFQGLMWITTLISYDKYCVKFRKMRLFGYVDFFIFRFELWNYPIFCKGVFVNCILSVVFEGFFITAYYGFVMCCDRYWVWFWDSYYIIPIIIRYLIFAIVHDCNHFVNIIWIEFHVIMLIELVKLQSISPFHLFRFKSRFVMNAWSLLCAIPLKSVYYLHSKISFKHQMGKNKIRKDCEVF